MVAGVPQPALRFVGWPARRSWLGFLLVLGVVCLVHLSRQYTPAGKRAYNRQVYPARNILAISQGLRYRTAEPSISSRLRGKAAVSQQTSQKPARTVTLSTKGTTANSSSHWIVVTSINPPTPSLRRLAALPGWTLLVVADKKTPADKYGSIKLLSVKDQLNLKYKIAKLLPWNSYSRKMIGYLYAIQHGAQYIYETDDDNLLERNMTFDLRTGPHPRQIVRTQNLTFNPYPHFGQSTVWPRGLPLDAVGMATPAARCVCSTPAPAVQQALVRGDPDVDAIFRLTRRAESRQLDLTFDPQAPMVVLPRGTFAPYNSQATLFHRDVFWSLYLPVTVSFRVCDIHRAYWAQALLWRIGRRLGFVAPSSVQRRNPHSYIRDLQEERQLNEAAPELLQRLRGWRCGLGSLTQCAGKLTADMVTWGQWQAREAGVLRAWLADLQAVGYTPPALQTGPAAQDCRKDCRNITHHPVEQKTSFPHTAEYFVAPGTAISKGKNKGS